MRARTPRTYPEQVAADADYQPALRPWSHAWRIVVVLVISGATFADTVGGDGAASRALVVVDLALGAVSFGLMFLRRRYPFAVAAVTSALTALSSTANGPSALALTSLATRRSGRQIATVATLNLAGSMVFQAVAPADGEGWFGSAVGSVLVLAALIGWGQFVGSRRELMWNLRQRAERAEADRDRRAAEARANERTRIAREMHDVVAHRISQVSMRAGAMAFRDDLSAEQMRAESTVIRDAANEALRELRSVLHVLRDPTTGDLVEQPQPTYFDIAALVDRTRGDGMRIDFVDEVTTPPSTDTGRTIYRMVQEGITNAAKHAPGALLHVAVANDGPDAVVVSMTNPRGFGRATPPGAGLGLVGIAERVAVAGGRFEQAASDTEFTLRAWLPCRT
jgi:signal transduction histidine kinase